MHAATPGNLVKLLAVVHDLKSGERAPVIDPGVVAECRATIDGIWKVTST